jgi:hypothetical protein
VEEQDWVLVVIAEDVGLEADVDCVEVVIVLEEYDTINQRQ